MSKSPNAGPHILLVDDNEFGLAARKTVLEELGYLVTTSSGAQKALEILDGGAFDLIVTDYKMPEMDGKEFIRRIKKEKPGVPVILISGFVDALGLDEKNTGADVVIQKSHNEVVHLVRSVSRLLKPPKKPLGSTQPPARKSRRQGR